VFIKENLKLLGWDTRNPARNPGGQVYTQTECFAHPRIKLALGLQRPENIVQVMESTCWVVEAKRTQRELGQAVAEAEDYARLINSAGGGGDGFRALFISGVAGNQTDGYVIRTKYLVGDTYRPVRFNGRDASGLLSPTIVRQVMERGPDIDDVPVDEAMFLATAERINEILHLGAINKDYRARVMAALLLALVEDTPLNVDAKPTLLIQEINARADDLLRRESKAEFFEYVRLGLPAARDNHIKFKRALVRTVQELQSLNIRSAMNSGTDVLGKFYEVFLRYGNGAKEIGIVLTPRHITRFAVEALNVTDRDIVYDPCCGTGGFLIAAFDYVKRTAGAAQVDRFKQNNLFGVDQESAVVSLAIVNMIFRGDGKNNIVEGNAFVQNLVRHTRRRAATAKYSRTAPSPDQAVISRVLMNPPFALKTSDEKEFRFVDTALRQMQHNGLLFCVLPYGAMVKSGEYQAWRAALLRDHTLVAVVTFPPDLFYPVGVHTVGIIVRKGVPHPSAQRVLWVRAPNDGMAKRKGKRLPDSSTPDDIQDLTALVRAFVADPVGTRVDNELMRVKASPVDAADPLMELVPENYLDAPDPSDLELAKGMELVMRDSLAYLMRAGRDHTW
jgi:type I restriction-modification system DNA methylase subunit